MNKDTKAMRLAYLDRPVVVTIFGCLLLSFAGALCQYTAAVQQRKSERIEQLRDKKYALLGRFCDRFEKDMTLLYNLRTQQVWLAKHRRPGDKDALGRSRAQVMSLYKDFVKDYNQNHQQIGMIYEVQALFKTEAVQIGAGELEKQVR